MPRLILFLTLFLFSAQSGVAESYRGIGIYAAMSTGFNCQRALSSLENVPRPAISVLWETFGTSTACMEAFTAKFKGQPHLLQIHFTNEVCRLHQRCGKEEFYPKLKRKEYSAKLVEMNSETRQLIVKRVQTILAAVNKFKNSNTELLLSTGLEDNYTPPAFESIRAVIDEQWPYGLVRSPMFKRKNIGTGYDFYELHRITQSFQPGQPPCIVNMDGTDADYGFNTRLKKRASVNKVRKWLNKWTGECHAVFLWRAAWQGLPDDKKKFIPPLNRKHLFKSKDAKITRKLLLGAE